MQITNMEWEPNLGTASSEIFKIMSTEIEEDFKKLFSGTVQKLCHQIADHSVFSSSNERKLRS